MANIILTRVDSRLIHGQVIAKWMKQYPAKTIVIIDEELAQDDFMGEIYKMAAPKGVTVEIVGAANAIAALNGIEGDVMLLFRDIKACHTMCMTGLAITSMIVGGVPGAPGKKAIASGVYLDKTDVEMLNEISQLSITVSVRVIPEEAEVSLEKVNTIIK